MHIFRVEDMTVTQAWKSGKSLEQIKGKFPDSDIREGTAECGQIEVTPGTFETPAAPVKSDDELDERALLKVDLQFKRTVLRALKEINQSDSSILSAKTKTGLQGLLSKLRS